MTAYHSVRKLYPVVKLKTVLMMDKRKFQSRSQQGSTTKCKYTLVTMYYVFMEYASSQVDACCSFLGDNKTDKKMFGGSNESHPWY